jgi:hypothetical protein
MNPLFELHLNETRRHFLQRAGVSLGGAALASLMSGDSSQAAPSPDSELSPAALPHFAPRAKRVIYLFQSGAPSQLELFDYKPGLVSRHSEDLPDSVRMGQRLTVMTSEQKKFPVAPSILQFAQHGQSGAWLSEVLPHTAGVVDDLCFVKSLHTEAINHDPAVTFITTGAQLAGRPSMGAWISYGLGSENQDLPTFVAMISRGTGRPNDQPLYDRLWGSGFLPSRYQGVKFRGMGDPVLYLSNPPGVDRAARRQMLDEIDQLNQLRHDAVGDPEIATRISQYELAYRMQTSVPELTDISGEAQHVLDLYGPDVTKPGTYAANCLLARRLVERGVRFVQLFHRGWDQHTNLPEQIRGQCSDTDQPTAALVRDLKQRGMLDDTLIVWGGEFGRTVYCQGKLTTETYGRDHHPRCFTVWLTGGGIRRGMTYGATDDYSYNITQDPVHVHDLNATILDCLGIDHERLTFKFQGRQHRLTDVHGQVVQAILA